MYLVCRVLERLLEVTERDCECSEGKVSPLYQAVLSERPASLVPFLRAGFNPDAQACFGYASPLELAMERYLDTHVHSAPLTAPTSRLTATGLSRPWLDSITVTRLPSGACFHVI